MGKKTEVLRYEADVEDAKRKVAELGDTEQQAMGKSQKATEGVSDAVKGLTKDKEKLAAAVRATGGSFSGMIGDLGGVVELMTQGGKAAIGLGAAMAGLSLAASVFNHIREQMRKVVEEEDKIAERFDKLKAQIVPSQEAMALALQRFGALTPAAEVATGEMRKRLQPLFGQAKAVEIAPTAVMAEMSPDEAALLAQLSRMELRFESPTEARQLLDRLRKEQPQVIATAQSQIDVMKQPKGKPDIANRWAASTPDLGFVPATAEDLALVRLQVTGQLGEEVEIEEFKERLLEAKALRGALRQMRGHPGLETAPIPQEYLPRLPLLPKLTGGHIERQAAEKRFDEIKGSALLRAFERAQATEMGETPTPTFDPGAGIVEGAEELATAGAKAVTIINNIQTTNIGTQIAPKHRAYHNRPGRTMTDRGRE